MWEVLAMRRRGELPFIRPESSCGSETNVWKGMLNQREVKDSSQTIGLEANETFTAVTEPFIDVEIKFYEKKLLTKS